MIFVPKKKPGETIQVVNSALGKTSANITLTPDGMATLYAQWKGVLVCVRVCV